MRSLHDITHNEKTVSDLLRLHGMWMWSETGGERAELRGADLCHADLRGADLRGADLRGAHLRWADLRKANLHEANLRWADLHEADLRGTNLRWADLHEADLRGTNLRWADLHEADLRGTNLRKANLHEANLLGVVGNMREIKSAQFDKWTLTWTQSPDGVHWLQIGCKRHTLEEWRDASDLWIDDMDEDALEWWHKHRDTVLGLVKASPATPWGGAQ